MGWVMTTTLPANAPEADLEELRRVMDATSSVVRKLTDERDRQKRDRLAVEEKRIVANLEAEYGASFSEAATVARDANLAYYAALEEHAKSGAGCSVPPGTKMIEWGQTQQRWAAATGPRKPTGLTGVVEVVTRAALHGARASYSHAEVGEFIIRHLKKDGTPGTRYDRFSRPWTAKYGEVVNVEAPHGWYPDGVDPNVKTVAGASTEAGK